MKFFNIATGMVAALIVSALATSARAADEYRNLGYLYLSPEPEAEYVSQQTRFVLVRFTDISPSDVTNLATFITVTGDSSGAHPGATHTAGDGRTVIFEMADDFHTNEVVSVSLSPQTEDGGATAPQPYEYPFRITASIVDDALLPIAAPAPVPPEISSDKEDEPTEPHSTPGRQTVAAPGRAGLMPNGVSVPSDFPFISITTNDNPDPGYIFLNHFGSRPYNVIFDNNGSPVWYQKMPDERRDMKVQPNGVLTMLARTGGMRFIGFNSNYQHVATYTAVNGYQTDEHELVVLEDGNYLLLGLRLNTVDMRAYVPGGNSNATVAETVVQEFTAAGELIFQWRAWDHFDIRDLNLQTLLGGSLDLSHMNAIHIDTDGHILVSSRHLSEITKINRDTGEIIWRMGGARNQFTFINDPLNGFENQHSISAVGTNRYLLFDNGNLHTPPMSRAVEYEVDTNNMTATVVWQYPDPPSNAYFSHYMANTQRLPNGNTLINWAINALPKLTEVRPDGTMAFEMNWASRYQTYRVWRCEWQGLALKPNLVIETYPDHLLLLFNKFGDTNVAYYRIYGGTTNNATNVIATSPIAQATLRNLENRRQHYFRVTAVDNNGVESGFSDETNVFVNIATAGENMLLNGDFSAQSGSWGFFVGGTASAAWTATNGDAFIDITSAGSQLSDIRLSQTDLKLIQGRQYTLNFDAWTDHLPRPFEARLGYLNILGPAYAIAAVVLTPAPQHFTHTFTMTGATDLNARLSFYAGASTSDVHVDNVELYTLAEGDLDKDRCVSFDDLKWWSYQWLRQGDGLISDLDGDSEVNFNDFDIIGSNWSGDCP